MKLTRQQRAAINDNASMVKCISGAGSGKTSVLTSRAVRLFDEGASAESIMLVTFTRKAAREMRDRITQSVRSCKGMLCDTFHALALHMLKIDGGALPISYDVERLGVLGEDDFASMVLDVCTELGYRNVKGGWHAGVSQTRVFKWFETYYSTGAYPRESLDPKHQGAAQRTRHPSSRSTRPIEIDAKRIIDETHIRMKRCNVVSYGMLICEALALMQIVTVRDRWLGLIRHVLVDEAQDCSPVQWQFVRAFSPPATLFVVGDPRQAIFGWRGASPEGMLELDGTTHSITTSFRCPVRVLDAANAMQSGYDPLDAFGKRLGTVTILAARESETYEPIARFIRNGCIHGRYSLADIAVLARTHRVLRGVETTLASFKISLHRVGAAFDIADWPAFKDLLAMLRLAVNPRDEAAFNRLRVHCGMGEADYRNLRNEGQRIGVPPLHVPGDWTLLHPLFEHCKAMSPDRKLGATLRALDQMSSRLAMKIQSFWLTHGSGMTVKQAVEWYSMREAGDDAASDNEVTLSTIHAAKGLEWPCVIVAACNEGDFPRNVPEAAEYAEEMRLVYVVTTRAKSTVAFHYSGVPAGFLEGISSNGG